MANKNVNGDVNVSFTEAASRQSLESGESVKTLFGKLRKWLSDLKPVAFSGSYIDLDNKPSIPSAVAVKGNAESTYRKGNVNLTPANIGALPTTGGTVTGNVIANDVQFQAKSTNIDRDGALPSSNTTGNGAIRLIDKDGEGLGTLSVQHLTDGNTFVYLNAFNEKSDGTQVGNHMGLLINRDGTRTYNIADPAAFRTAIGLNNVDNTSDANKPISTATQAALDTKVSKSGDTITGDLRFNTVEFINDTDMFWVSSVVSSGSKKPFYFDVADIEIAFIPSDDIDNGYLEIRHGTGGSKIGVDYVAWNDLIAPGLYFEGAGTNNSSHVHINDNISLNTEHLYLNSEELFATTVRYDTPSQGLTDTEKSNAINNLALPNAGFHNSIFRGKYLGSSFTSSQKAAIANSTFDDLFVGDYWTINGVNWRIADIDYKYGDVNTHHLIIVPDTILYNSVWNSTSDTSSGYAGSDIYTSGLSSALSTIENAFGSSYIMEHTNLLTNAASNGVPTGWADYTIKISLLNQTMLLGHRSVITAYGDYRNDGQNTVQLALFRLCPQYRKCSSWYWLSDVALTQAAVACSSNVNVFVVTQSRGVRPYFCLKGE